MIYAFLARYFGHLLVVFLVAVGSLTVGVKLGSDSEARRTARVIAEAQARTDAALARADEASRRFEKARTQRQQQAQVITKEIVREVEKPVYRECAVPADGVRLLNAARGHEGPGEPGGALPADPEAAE